MATPLHARTDVQRLVLFDIDGTLLTSNGAAAKAFRGALLEVFGTEGPTRGYSFAGKTDPQIARELLHGSGMDPARVDEGLERLWGRYLERLGPALREVEMTVFPGVRPLVERLAARRDAVLGLLTGNVREGARMKLERAGLGFERFSVGAFGSDHADRRELPAVAVRRAEERFGHQFTEKSVVIIGDTPSDVACGEHLGVRTIAVATGSFGAEELRECGPDYLFESLADTEAVWRAIFD